MLSGPLPPDQAPGAAPDGEGESEQAGADPNILHNANNSAVRVVLPEREGQGEDLAEVEGEPGHGGTQQGCTATYERQHTSMA